MFSYRSCVGLVPLFCFNGSLLVSFSGFPSRSVFSYDCFTASASCSAFRRGFGTGLDTLLLKSLGAGGFCSGSCLLTGGVLPALQAGRSSAVDLLPAEDGRLLSRMLSDDCALVLLGRNLLVGGFLAVVEVFVSSANSLEDFDVNF